jgi:hypothetical protein
MDRIDTGDPDRLEFFEGPGIHLVLGTLMVLFGVGMVVFWAVVTPDDLPVIGISAVVGGVVALLGLTRALRRAGVAFDRRNGTVTAWHASLWAVRQTHRLADFNTVHLGWGDRKTGCAVSLVGPDKRVVLVVPEEPLAARHLAEEAARFLGLSLTDETGETPGKQAEDPAPPPDAGPTSLPPPPAGHRFELRRDGERLVISIPPPPLVGALAFPLLLGVGLAVLLGALLFAAVLLMGEERREALTWEGHVVPALCVTVGVGAVGVLVGVFFEVPAWTRQTVEADPTGVRVTWRGLLFTRSDALSTAELRELRLVGRSILILGTERALQIGPHGLSRAEAEWIRDALRRTLLRAQPQQFPPSTLLDRGCR